MPKKFNFGFSFTSRKCWLEMTLISLLPRQRFASSQASKFRRNNFRREVRTFFAVLRRLWCSETKILLDAVKCSRVILEACWYEIKAVYHSGSPLCYSTPEVRSHSAGSFDDFQKRIWKKYPIALSQDN